MAKVAVTTSSRLRTALADSVPSPAMVLFGSAGWGVAVAAASVCGLYFRDELIHFSRLALITLFFYGPAAGFAPGLVLARLLARGRSAPVRFAIGTVVMALATHTATGVIFALQYRVFYAHWHADFPSIIWFYQLAFTAAAALYQFTVDSLYSYFPATFLLFLAFGLWFARRPH